MRAIIVSKNKEKIVELIEKENITKINNDEVIVKTLYCSLCHSDLTTASGILGD
ncbi:hypothetical protein [Spiroplasma taiwanense]|uniref:Alcohol dehydrogenase n=1 Tax=Spiroplasma taiwanense CT-1 TaxID=1276220 RepID=S5MFU9_9MOLU|nr:hypothetical protein [Spiroplasma taiwanense]AGR40735.1 hypothetical protein STAIW_v1c00380 [Spiroplasma taiwanense CT-1]